MSEQTQKVEMPKWFQIPLPGKKGTVEICLQDPADRETFRLIKETIEATERLLFADRSPVPLRRPKKRIPYREPDENYKDIVDLMESLKDARTRKTSTRDLP